jgi:hypothetical protein
MMYWKGTWEKSGTAYYKVLAWNFPGGAKKGHK